MTVTGVEDDSGGTNGCDGETEGGIRRDVAVL